MITKRVTLQWDEENECWRDQMTGVLVTGYSAPQPDPQFVKAGHGTFIPEQNHPFDKSFTVTYEQVQRMISDAFDQRVIPEHPHYFIEDHRIVTYAWLKREGDLRKSHIDNLQYQIDRLHREINKPWWKRW